MEFAFETVYNQKAVAAMARALRKTIRKQRNRRSHIFGWTVVAAAMLLTLPLGDRGFTVGVKTIITWIAALAILIVLLFEDKINGYVARKRMLTGMDKAATVFSNESYISTTDIGTSEFHYDHINMIAETGDYFVFVFDESHAQVYDKHTLSGGTVDEFIGFITEKTGKEVVRIEKI